MAGNILVARKTAALLFEGRTFFIEEGVTMAREGHAILAAAGSMFEPLRVHFEVEEDLDADPGETTTTPETPDVPPAAADVPQDTASAAPAPKDVRAWAAEQGIDVPARGKPPEAVVEQYLAAQGA